MASKNAGIDPGGFHGFTGPGDMFSGSWALGFSDLLPLRYKAALDSIMAVATDARLQ